MAADFAVREIGHGESMARPTDINAVAQPGEMKPL
jgi:hypothetical protein